MIGQKMDPFGSSKTLRRLLYACMKQASRYLPWLSLRSDARLNTNQTGLYDLLAQAAACALQRFIQRVGAPASGCEARGRLFRGGARTSQRSWPSPRPGFLLSVTGIGIEEWIEKMKNMAPNFPRLDLGYIDADVCK